MGKQFASNGFGGFSFRARNLQILGFATPPAFSGLTDDSAVIGQEIDETTPPTFAETTLVGRSIRLNGAEVATGFPYTFNAAGFASVVYTDSNGDTVTFSLGTIAVIDAQVIRFGSRTPVGAAAMPVTGIANGTYGASGEYTVAGGLIYLNVFPSPVGNTQIGSLTLENPSSIASAHPDEIEAAKNNLDLNAGGFVLVRDGETSVDTNLSASAFVGDCIIEPENWTNNADPRFIETPTKLQRIICAAGSENIKVRGFELYADMSGGNSEAFGACIRFERPNRGMSANHNVVMSRSMTDIYDSNDFGTSYADMKLVRGISTSGGLGLAVGLDISHNYISNVTVGVDVHSAVSDGAVRSKVDGNYIENGYNNAQTITGLIDGLDVTNNRYMHSWHTATALFAHASIGGSTNAPDAPDQFKNFKFEGNHHHMGWAKSALWQRDAISGIAINASGVKINNGTRSDSYENITIRHNLLVATGLVIEVSAAKNVEVSYNTVTNESYTGNLSAAVINFSGVQDLKLVGNIANGYGFGVYDGFGEKGRQLINVTGTGSLTAGQAITFSPSGIGATVRTAVGALGTQEIEVFINPEDLALVEAGETFNTTGGTATTDAIGAWTIPFVKTDETMIAYNNLHGLTSAETLGDYSMETILQGHSTKGFTQLDLSDLPEAYTPVAGSYAETAKVGAIGTGYYVGEVDSSPAITAKPVPSVTAGVDGDLTTFTAPTHLRYVGKLQNGGADIASGKDLTIGWGGRFDASQDGTTIALFSTNGSRLLVRRLSTDNKLRFNLRNAALEVIFEGTSTQSYGSLKDLVRFAFTIQMSTGRVLLAVNGSTENLPMDVTIFEDDNIAMFEAGVWYINADAAGANEFSGDFEQCFMLPQFIDFETQAGLDQVFAADGKFIDFGADGSTAFGAAIPILVGGDAAILNAGNGNNGDGGSFLMRDGPVVDVGAAGFAVDEAASGGVFTTVNGFRVWTATSDADLVVTTAGDVSSEMIANGGNGGGRLGGGAGAGQLLFRDADLCLPVGTYSAVMGAAGTAGDHAIPATPPENTTFAGLKAISGGIGGTQGGGDDGGDGASGGGGANQTGSIGGDALSPNGNAGIGKADTGTAGGGGGEGGAPSGVNGGAGVQSNIPASTETVCRGGKGQAGLGQTPNWGDGGDGGDNVHGAGRQGVDGGAARVVVWWPV